MHIVVPLAGREESYIEAFGEFKPFVPLQGRTLIEHALGCLPLAPEQLTFVCLREYAERFDVEQRLAALYPGASVVWAEQLTQGSACSALLAVERMDPEEEVLVNLADVLFDPLDLFERLAEQRPRVAGVIPVEPGVRMERRWGYTYPRADGSVAELREKELDPTSLDATLGLYYFSQARHFVSCVTRMVQQERREPHTGLYFVGPAYNLLIEDGLRVETARVHIRANLGSVADVRRLNAAPTTG